MCDLFSWPGQGPQNPTGRISPILALAVPQSVSRTLALTYGLSASKPLGELTHTKVTPRGQVQWFSPLITFRVPTKGAETGHFSPLYCCLVQATWSVSWITAVATQQLALIPPLLPIVFLNTAARVILLKQNSGPITP